MALQTATFRIEGVAPLLMNNVQKADPLNKWAKALKADVMTLWYAYQDPQCPSLSKLLVGFIVAYALSPIDLIPDFIPVIGYLDEMILLPILITIAIKTIPNQVFTTAKAKATENPT